MSHQSRLENTGASLSRPMLRKRSPMPFGTLPSCETPSQLPILHSVNSGKRRVACDWIIRCLACCTRNVIVPLLETGRLVATPSSASAGLNSAVSYFVPALSHPRCAGFRIACDAPLRGASETAEATDPHFVAATNRSMPPTTYNADWHAMCHQKEPLVYVFEGVLMAKKVKKRVPFL